MPDDTPEELQIGGEPDSSSTQRLSGSQVVLGPNLMMPGQDVLCVVAYITWPLVLRTEGKLESVRYSD